MDKKEETLYIFMDSYQDTGKDAIKCCSKNKEEVLTFIANYALTEVDDCSYFEIAEVTI